MFRFSGSSFTVASSSFGEVTAVLFLGWRKLIQLLSVVFQQHECFHDLKIKSSRSELELAMLLLVLMDCE